MESIIDDMNTREFNDNVMNKFGINMYQKIPKSYRKVMRSLNTHAA